MKDDCDRLFDRAFQVRIEPEIAWFERSRNCSGWPLGGSKTQMESSASKDTPHPNQRGFYSS